MSEHTIPRHLANRLREQADANCPDCDGAGLVAYTATNRQGYREVRCPCVDRVKGEDR